MWAVVLLALHLITCDAFCDRKFGAHDALLVIDVQNGFLPLRAQPQTERVQPVDHTEVDAHGNILAGSLAVDHADEIIPVINTWINYFISVEPTPAYVMASLDWHPSNSCSFCSNGTICSDLGVDHCGLEGDENADCPESLKTRCEDSVSVHDYLTDVYVQWPEHCVQGTWSAQFDSYLEIPHEAIVVKKGFVVQNDSYSAYGGRVGTTPFPFNQPGDTEFILDGQPDLKSLIEQYNINRLWVSGIATDFCVKNSILDSLGANVAGLSTRPSTLAQPNSVILIQSATRGVAPDTTAEAIALVEAFGAIVIPSHLTTPDDAINYYCDFIEAAGADSSSAAGQADTSSAGAVVDNGSGHNDDSTNTATAIGLGIGMSVLGLAIIAILCVFCNRRTITPTSTNYADQDDTYKPLHDL